MEYIAIIGDIVDSKKIEYRGNVQEKLFDTLNQINEIYQREISARFVITLGDEFQGLLYGSGHLLDIVKYIQQEMYPVKIRFGIGIGEISTVVFHNAAIGADGPAYYAARAMIEDLRKQERKMKKQAPDIQISAYYHKNLEIAQINMILAMIKIIENGWSDKQRYTIWDMERHGGSQEACAMRMGATQSTVARRLADGNYITYERAKRIVKDALKNLGIN